MTEEEEDSLHLYAINFRGAHAHHAAEMWQKLKMYVDRLVAEEREPLTEAQIYELLGYGSAAQYTSLPQYALACVRAIEKAHGIG